jgi:hypothetical protein
MRQVLPKSFLLTLKIESNDLDLRTLLNSQK